MPRELPVSVPVQEAIGVSDPDPSKPDLSTATITELVTELKSRHDSLLVLGEIDRTDELTSWCSYTKGGWSRLLGMLTRARRRIMVYIAEHETESEE